MAVNDRALDWKSSEIDARGVLQVPIVPEPDEPWGNALKMALQALQRETRGQQYRSLSISDGLLVADGVPVNNVKPTADFLDVLVTQANTWAERNRQQWEELHQQAERRAETATEEAERSTQALRERGWGIGTA